MDEIGKSYKESIVKWITKRSDIQLDTLQILKFCKKILMTVDKNSFFKSLFFTIISMGYPTCKNIVAVNPHCRQNME